MFVSLPSRRKPPVRWATPALLVLLSATFCWALTLGEAAKAHLLTQWGALTGGMVAPEVWLASLQRGTVLRLFTALFLHADWAHLLGNLVFLLIFGLPAERVMGPWRFLLLFLRAPAFLLIGIWAGLQVLFAYIGPAFGAVAWAAHVAGFLFGVLFALLVRAGIARRLRRQRGY